MSGAATERVDVHRPERLPARGPVLLCVNHPNNLIDPLLVGAVVGCQVHSLATAALFRNPLAARFLCLAGALTADERRAVAEEAHAGGWETSMMLMLRPDLVDGGWRSLPSATYPAAARLFPNYPLRNGGKGYVGHPGLADPASRSPAALIPSFRAHLWPLATAGVLTPGRLWPRREPRS